MTGNPARVRDLQELASIWRKRGLRVLEMPGWQDRGRESGNTFEVLGCHHTASAQDVDRILRDGRPDVPGPLCSVALHANGEVVLVASGRANHFGVATWPSSRALGVEATGPPFANYPQYVQLAAGFCEWKGRQPASLARGDPTIPVYLIAAHKEVAQPYGRKPNPAGEGFNNGGRTIAGVQLIDNFRADVARALLKEEDDMTQDEHDALMWLRQNATLLRDQGVRMTAMGDPDGPSDRQTNNLANVLARLDELKALVAPQEPPA